MTVAYHGFVSVSTKILQKIYTRNSLRLNFTEQSVARGMVAGQLAGCLPGDQLYGMFSGGGMSVDKFIAAKKGEKELEG
jgi:hypothetical protein